MRGCHTDNLASSGLCPQACLQLASTILWTQAGLDIVHDSCWIWHRRRPVFATILSTSGDERLVGDARSTTVEYRALGRDTKCRISVNSGRFALSRRRIVFGMPEVLGESLATHRRILEVTTEALKYVENNYRITRGISHVWGQMLEQRVAASTLRR